MQDSTEVFSLLHAFVERMLAFERLPLITILLALAMIILSGPISRFMASAISLFFKLIKVRLSDLVKGLLRDIARAFLIALAVLAILQTLTLPDRLDRLLEQVLASGLLLYLMTVVYRLIDRLISEALPPSSSASKEWIINAARIIVIIFAFVIILEVWGVNISSAAAGVGVFGAGVAIALQDFFKNFAAGLSNQGERRFRRGDWVATDEVEGIVERIDLRSTMIMGFDRIPRFVPNNALADSILMNKSRMDHRRISWTIPLVMDASDAQIETVCSELRKHIEESGDFVTDGSRPCIIMPTGLSESSIDIMLYAFSKTSDWQAWLKICSRLVIALRSALKEAGTSVAYPTQTVQFQSENIMPASDLQQTTQD